MTQQNQRKGIWLIVLAMMIFALQDGLSRHLSSNYNVYMVVMIRYWFFAAFVIALSARKPGGIRQVLVSHHPWLQATRSVLLVAEVLVIIQAFILLGLVETHAIFISTPLLVAALSGPLLGEKVGWRRWGAIGIGFVGMMVILQPGAGVFRPAALIPLAGALMFAVYVLLTRYVSRKDNTAVSFFWTGTLGAVIATLAGIWFWEPMTPGDWGWMGVLCLTAASGHWLLIRAYEVAEASAVQPFTYLQLVFVAILGVTLFDEVLRPNVVIGALIVVGAGLFTLWRSRVRGQDSGPEVPR